jgi:hypothetical protein
MDEPVYIAFAELATRYPEVYEHPPLDLFGYQRESCPVCGHPSGDCC